ncbi:oocyte zinc finger protein XlCOF28-like isoform X2 [Armigeres subalbatus]|uniref:oocyte zinc finger protein XlCOF28-like isoform X2 n=1 Tax=Armigeres subalbatus TaxID=124917 RepID=UPI002ED602C8
MDLYRLRDRFEHLCRFCLSEDDCVPIFTENLQLNDHLATLLDILLAKIDDNDGYPNNICAKCVHCIDQFVQFEAECEKSYEILGNVRNLQNERNIVSPINNEQAQNDNIVIGNEEDHVDEKPTEDEEQSNIESDEALVERLDDEQSVIGEEQIEFEVLDIDHISEDEQESSNKSTPGRLTVEQQQMLDKAMQVPTSGFIKRGNRSVPLVECIYCKNTYRGRNTLKKHLRIHLNIKGNQCAYCPKTFTDRSSLRIHEGRHTGRSFKCHICDKQYYSQNELRQHLTMQHLERKHTCETCQKKFPSKTILNDHYRVHTMERPFVCRHCGTGFKRNRNLVRHELLHDKTKTETDSWQMPCMVCADQFDDPNGLLEHLRTEHADRFHSFRSGSFECPQCDVDAFDDIEECLKHRQMHYDAYKSPVSANKRKQYNRQGKDTYFCCGECKKKFKSRIVAMKHMSTHDGTELFQCEENGCRFLFRKASTMNLHQIELHGSNSGKTR